jgi:transposase
LLVCSRSAGSFRLARFVVDIIAQLALSAIYSRYAPRGGQPYAPEILLGLLFYGYATGVFSTRKLERATYETVPFRCLQKQSRQLQAPAGPPSPPARRSRRTVGLERTRRAG